ncbi:MAG TPA: hypothetical protein VK974_04265 [Methylophilaceae bacterium]|nr:hypothetical protein [Methylophilaceae bacterium]
MTFIRLITALFLTTYASQGYCARPMVTDDARVVDPKSCQVESWVKLNKGSNEFWALPGCNVGQNLEITYGGAMTRESGESTNTDMVMQAKTLLRTLKTNDYGIGLVVGHARHPNRNNDDNMIGDAYLYVPVSLSMLDDNFVLHTNLGVIHDREEKINKVTWGIGSETLINKDTYFIAEVYGDNQSRAFHQLGLRYWLVPNRVQVDTTYGNRFANDTEERWFTVGLRLLSTPFLP